MNLEAAVNLARDLLRSQGSTPASSQGSVTDFNPLQSISSTFQQDFSVLQAISGGFDPSRDLDPQNFTGFQRNSAEFRASLDLDPRNFSNFHPSPGPDSQNFKEFREASMQFQPSPGSDSVIEVLDSGPSPQSLGGSPGEPMAVPVGVKNDAGPIIANERLSQGSDDSTLDITQASSLDLTQVFSSVMPVCINVFMCKQVGQNLL